MVRWITQGGGVISLSTLEPLELTSDRFLILNPNRLSVVDQAPSDIDITNYLNDHADLLDLADLDQEQKQNKQPVMKKDYFEIENRVAGEDNEKENAPCTPEPFLACWPSRSSNEWYMEAPLVVSKIEDTKQVQGDKSIFYIASRKLVDI